ncbi:MAG: magnesium transporter CorA [Chitinophagaceae bacterium]|nr:magnesium transporter CorA [Chitinophagaceae bacterium]
MLKQLASKQKHTYEWIDLLNPDESEVHELAVRYGLHEASVIDALQQDHLPKYELVKDYVFLILRIYDPVNEVEADTAPELTNKLAIFISDSYIITIHRSEWAQLEQISRDTVETGVCKNPRHVLLQIMKAGLHTYDRPIGKLTSAIEYYEEQVFLKDKHKPILKGLYFVKRKVDVIRRLLLLTYESVDRLDPTDTSNAYSRDLRDLYVKQQTIFDTLSENTNHLLGIYFSISAQRTNETIRVLTIFSVFFMPLTFIVGIYGMNFEHMPELKWKLGYPGVMILMLLIVVIILTWFKRKRWL